MTRRLTIAIPVVIIALSGCVTIRVDESFWLTPRPGAGFDVGTIADAGPAALHLRRISARGGTVDEVPALAATRADARATVLFLGSDDFVIAGMGGPTIAALAGAAPINVVLVEYPGHGERRGPQSLDRLKEEGLAVYDLLAADSTAYTPCVVVHGHSLGSFLAAYIAAHRDVCGLVLQSSATNPQEWMRSFFRPARFKWWARPAYPFLRISLAPELAAEDNQERVRNSAAPLLVLVGDRDDITIPAMSHQLFRASAAPDSLKWIVELPGRGHEDVLTSEAFAPAYREFVAAAVRRANR